MPNLKRNLLKKSIKKEGKLLTWKKNNLWNDNCIDGSPSWLEAVREKIREPSRSSVENKNAGSEPREIVMNNQKRA